MFLFFYAWLHNLSKLGEGDVTPYSIKIQVYIENKQTGHWD